MKAAVKSKLSIIFIGVLFGGLALWWIIWGTLGLAGTANAKPISDDSRDGDYVSIETYLPLGEVLQIDHKLNLIFPTGTEHYVLVYPVGLEKCYVVMTTDLNGVLDDANALSGKLAKPDSEIAKEIYKAIKDTEIESSVTVLCLNACTVSDSLIRLGEGLLIAVLFLYILVLLNLRMTKHIPPAQVIPDATEPVLQTESGGTNGIKKLFRSKPALIVFVVLLLAAMLLLIVKGYVLFPDTGTLITSG